MYLHHLTVHNFNVRIFSLIDFFKSIFSWIAPQDHFAQSQQIYSGIYLVSMRQKLENVEPMDLLDWKSSVMTENSTRGWTWSFELHMGH